MNGATHDAPVHLRAIAPHLVAAPAALRARWLEEAASMISAPGWSSDPWGGLGALAALAAAWGSTPAVAAGGGRRIGPDTIDADVRALPSTVPALVSTGGDLDAASPGIVGALVSAAVQRSATGRGDHVGYEAVLGALREMRRRVPAETWERTAWRLEAVKGER